VRRVSRGGDDPVPVCRVTTGCGASRAGVTTGCVASRAARDLCVAFSARGIASRSAGLSPNSRGRPSSGQLVATQPRGGTTWRNHAAAVVRHWSVGRCLSRRVAGSLSSLAVACRRLSSLAVACRRLPSLAVASRRARAVLTSSSCSDRFRIVFGSHETMNCARLGAHSRGAHGQDYREARVR
jgi:hypothetical protein